MNQAIASVSQAEVEEMSELINRDADEMSEVELEAATSPDSPKPAIDNSKDVRQPIAPKDAHWLEDGVNLGKVFNESDKTRKTSTLMYAGKYLAEGEATDDFLKGFKESLGGTSSAIQTASKVKAVFAAYHVPNYKRVVGNDEKTKEPIFAEKSGAQWLIECTDGWEKFTSLAREIRGPIVGKGAGGGPKEKKSLKAEEVTKMEESIKLASPEQAEKIATKAIDTILAQNGGKDAEKKAVVLIYQMVGVLTDSQDLSYQKLAQDLQGVLNDFDNERIRLEQEAKKDQVVVNE
jgi:hypothetical protein